MIEAQRDQEKQLRLIEIDADQLSLPSSNGGSAFCDPAFASNKTLPLHRWVPWIAGFSSDFVKDALSRYLNGKGTVSVIEVHHNFLSFPRSNYKLQEEISIKDESMILLRGMEFQNFNCSA
jgi:hypothetical protein